MRSEEGFAMPMTVLVLVVLALGLTGSLSFVTSERRVIDNVSQQQQAFVVAQEGLDEFLANRTSYGFSGTPAATETVEIDIGDGTAEIVLTRMRDQVGATPALYAIRSTGEIPGPRPQDPPARRTVAQMAQWESGTIDAKASWMSLTGLHKNGNSGSISGVDRCSAQPDVPGVSVPDDPGFTENGGFSPTGTPAVEEWATVQAMIDDLDIDWEGIANMTSITPDIVMPGGTWPSFADSAYWPIIHATGDFSLPSTGRGILIVTGGSLAISGNKTWEGIVLVGEHLTSNGNNTVYGAVYTGLDAMLADDPEQWIEDMGQTAIGNGNKTYRYDSCSIASAMQSFGGFDVLPNAWMDNWPVE
jgi:Tfp pilus assembly protein PilX